jgi:hypothetical protein
MSGAGLYRRTYHWMTGRVKSEITTHMSRIPKLNPTRTSPVNFRLYMASVRRKRTSVPGSEYYCTHCSGEVVEWHRISIAVEDGQYVDGEDAHGNINWKDWVGKEYFYRR